MSNKNQMNYRNFIKMNFFLLFLDITKLAYFWSEIMILAEYRRCLYILLIFNK